MKKTLALFIVMVMVLSVFVGCSQKPAEAPAATDPAVAATAAPRGRPSPPQSPAAKAYKIGYVQPGGSYYYQYQLDGAKNVLEAAGATLVVVNSQDKVEKRPVQRRRPFSRRTSTRSS